MQKSVTAKQIQDMDRTVIEKVGIPSIVLMENAGRAVAQEVLRSLKNQRRARVVIVCGTGNNGGDGFVAARHLMNAGVSTHTLIIGRLQDLKLDAAINYRILKNLKCPVDEISASDQKLVKAIVTKSHAVIDAIFGVGLNRKILEPLRGIIQLLNASGKRIFCVDIPSGLDATTGRIHGVCVQATKTVTFSLLKQGFLKGEGPRYAGKVVIVNIGIPTQFIENRHGRYKQ